MRSLIVYLVVIIKGTNFSWISESMGEMSVLIEIFFIYCSKIKGILNG